MLFLYDVFLSHSSKDKDTVREIAQDLKSQGLKVWFDEWEILPGDSIFQKIEEGIEQSRILVLCMSAFAFGSDWATLESQTVRFRDPMNRERRFIPLRLDETPPKGTLVQFQYIDWRKKGAGGAREKLYASCVAMADHSNTRNVELGIFEPPSIPGLKLSINPTRDNSGQLAQLRLLNTEERPVLIDAWFLQWDDKSWRETIRCIRGSLPVRLQCHERADLLVEISDRPVKELKRIGVIDAERRFCWASEREIGQFVHIAKMYEPPTASQVNKQCQETCEVKILVDTVDVNGDLCLAVKVKNIGSCEFELQSAAVEWVYDPPREMTQEMGQVSVKETGGAMSIGSPMLPATLHATESFTLVLSADNLVLPTLISMIRIVDGDSPYISVATLQGKFVVKSDEVRDAITRFVEGARLKR